jgi:hypothetical protein
MRAMPEKMLPPGKSGAVLTNIREYIDTQAQARAPQMDASGLA